MGIDKIKLKLDDRTVHPLIEVQCVPDLIKNLTSVDFSQFKSNIGGIGSDEDRSHVKVTCISKGIQL